MICLQADIDTEAVFAIRFYCDRYHSDITVAENTRGIEAGSKDKVKNKLGSPGSVYYAGNNRL